MLIVGLTGGIASGKSLVSRVFKELGAHVIDADRIVHDLVSAGTEAWNEIRARFGDEILLPDRSIFEDWLRYIYGFADLIGLNRDNFFNNELSEKERAHYSKRTVDIEYKFPWAQDELWALAFRTDFDLSQHQEMSGKNLEYFDEATKKKYIPHVIEPTFGIDRTLLAVLTEGDSEEKDPEGKPSVSNGAGRIVLKLNPKVAPYKAAIFPLLANKPELVKLAKEIYDDLRQELVVDFDDRGNIGKRYYSQDEIGTPWCVTVDFDSLKDKQVHLRSCQQQGFGIAAENGNGQMLQNRICEQVREMLRNMIRNQTGTSPGSGTAALSQEEDGQMIKEQNRLLEQKRIQAGLRSGNGMVSLSGSADQLRDRVRDMIRNQTRLQDGSCGICPGL